MTDYNINPFENDSGRKNCQRHDNAADNQEVVFTEGYKERENVEDWQYRAPEQLPHRYREDEDEDDKSSRFLTYFMGATIAGVLLFAGLKEGCRRDDAYEKAKERHIQENYNPKGLQKKIQEERE